MKQCLHETRLCSATLLCLLLTVVARPAYAQGSPFGRGPLTLSIGTYVPNNIDKADNSSSGASAYGGTLALGSSRARRLPLLYVNYQQSALVGTQRNRIWGAGVSEKTYFREPYRRDVAFFSHAGVGAYSVHGANTDGAFVSTQTVTQAGVSAGVGLEVRRGDYKGFTLEAAYTFLPQKVAGVSESGLTVYSGIRF